MKVLNQLTAQEYSKWTAKCSKRPTTQTKETQTEINWIRQEQSKEDNKLSVT